MRKILIDSLGDRKKFVGTFVRLGKKKNYRGYSEETILLKDIKDVETGKIVTDHVWFAYTKSFQSIALLPGAQIEFVARIKQYEKGYRNVRYKIDNRTIDYKLSHPTKISLVAP
jgi:hypothetical protein